MISQDLVSIVVPVYAVEEYIGECIESLLEQKHSNVEIILVDDGSTDASGSICDWYSRLDRRIRVVHKANGGLVSARKHGVAASTGEYLGFVDGDDWVAPDFISSMLECAQSHSADLVVCGHVRDFLGKREDIPPRTEPGFYDRNAIEERILPTAVYNGTFFQHGISTYVWNKLFKREHAAKIVSRVPEGVVMGEDAALTYPYLAECNRIVVSDASTYFYRQRPHSIVKSLPPAHVEYERLSLLFQYLKEEFIRSSCSATLLSQLRYYFFAQVVIRSGGVISSPVDGSWFSPFDHYDKHHRIVVYNSGSFGQHLVNALDDLGSFDLVGWIDEDHEESQNSGLPVTSLDSVTHMDFDLLAIAAIDSEYCSQLTERLERLGIENEKITFVKPDFSQLSIEIENAGFNLETYGYRTPGDS